MQLTDKDQIRQLLLRDPRWCVYALGDLTPRMFAKCQWFEPDLTLVLHDYGTSILFAIGTGSIREALDHVRWPVHLQVQQDGLDEVARHADVTAIKQMWRMGWEGTELKAIATEGSENTGVKRLTATHLPQLKLLYADGESAGESPDFFYDSMVSDGVFFGVFEGEALVAAAGTHLVSRDEGAAAIGNVYTRRDRRGRGYSRAATSAVLQELKDLPTIGLNVRADNTSAIRVYQSLGFIRHCEFVEAIATRSA
ncbi:MAG TPA: GNAT family N-acetyltransferase [Vicinamibacterales bacterium]|nr:GNAT family N-acetyltransferase [Vicinamibacterales bacterium]